jgi:hypothetical protein
VRQGGGRVVVHRGMRLAVWDSGAGSSHDALVGKQGVELVVARRMWSK